MEIIISVLLNNGWRRALPGLWGHEDRLVELEQILPVVESSFISYLRTIRELHIICITSEFTEAAWKMALFNFEQKQKFFMKLTT